MQSLVLRGIFLCREEDIKWFYQSGAHQIFPDHWSDFIDLIPIQERTDILKAFHQRIHGDDVSLSNALCKKWAIWEGRCSTLYSSADVVSPVSYTHLTLPTKRIV